jgi:hypothetical protein
MRTERLLAGGMLASGLVVATFAFAQTRNPRGARPGDRTSPPPAASTGAAVAPAPAAGGAPAVDAGAATAPPPVLAPVAEAADGGRLSPLTPAPNEFSEAGAPAASFDYDRLLSDLAALRARVAAVSDTLFHSRIAISVETSGDRARIAGLGVSLDDGIVWTSPASFRADDATVVYDHAVAPGNHAVTIDVERRDAKNDTFRTIQRSRFIVDVPSDQRLAVEVKLWDDSSMGDFPGDKQGQYELRVRARAKAQPLGR